MRYAALLGEHNLEGFVRWVHLLVLQKLLTGIVQRDVVDDELQLQIAQIERDGNRDKLMSGNPVGDNLRARTHAPANTHRLGQPSIH